MTKILIVTDAWHPQVNGVVTVVAKMKELSEARGMSVEVIHPGLFTAIPLFFYPEIRIPLVWRRSIGKAISRSRPDHIHIVTEGALGLAARSACVKEGLRFTTAYHTHFPHYVKARLRLFAGVVEAYLRWFHNAGAATMVSTPSLKSDLENRGFKNVVIRPLGVDTGVFRENKESPHRNLVGPVFVYFGRLAVEKGVEEYFRCNLPGTKLVIGEGPLRRELEQKYGSTFLFLGYKKGQDLVDWLSVADVFVFPSRTETFGLVALEAMACGVRVAAHDVMGPKDIITPGVDGYLDENLETAALKCLPLKREDCRKKAEKYTWDASVDAFLQNLVVVKNAAGA